MHLGITKCVYGSSGIADKNKNSKKKTQNKHVTKQHLLTSDDSKKDGEGGGPLPRNFFIKSLFPV